MTFWLSVNGFRVTWQHFPSEVPFNSNSLTVSDLFCAFPGWPKKKILRIVLWCSHMGTAWIIEVVRKYHKEKGLLPVSPRAADVLFWAVCGSLEKVSGIHTRDYHTHRSQINVHLQPPTDGEKIRWSGWILLLLLLLLLLLGLFRCLLCKKVIWSRRSH